MKPLTPDRESKLAKELFGEQVGAAPEKSPAISPYMVYGCLWLGPVELSKSVHCYKPHNAPSYPIT